MASVSARYLDLASRSKGELEAVFAAGSPPDVAALTGFEFRGYNQPRAAARRCWRREFPVTGGASAPRGPPSATRS